MVGGCEAYRDTIVRMSTPDSFKPQGDPSDMSPVYEGPDAKRKRLAIELFPVATGFLLPVDVQFVPGNDLLLVVLEKNGAAHWRELNTGARGKLLEVEVLTDSEQGLLGLAFHPRFRENGLFFINYTTRHEGREITRVSRWQTALDGTGLTPARGEKVILEVEQPYANHNGGQLQFGPDGYLYIGLGDGGWVGDPKNHAQNTASLLGAILRIDVDGASDGNAYAIPADNPFLDVAGARPELWAIGLRNPWRYSLDEHGRVVAGDVGQEKWEEVTVISAGENHGWNFLEGRHCYRSPCRQEGLTPPVFEYPHGDDGRSVTGGYVATGDLAPSLRGKYVFGDFISGRIWAIELPEKVGPDTRPVDAYTLGKWPILPASFGRNNAGDVFVADFSSGTVFAIAAPKPTENRTGGGPSR